MTKNKKKKSHNLLPNLSESILKILNQDSNKTFNYKQIAAKLGVDDASSRNQIIKKLKDLQGKEKVQ